MPVEFLNKEQKTGYGQFSGEPNDAQLARYFLLDEADMAFISERRGEQNRLGFALQITVARFLGTFFPDLTVVPQNVKVFVANQLSIKDIRVLSGYAQRDNTRWEHTALIRDKYGYHDFGSPPWSFRLSRLLYSRSWISDERPSLMFDFATAWLIQHKVLLPGVTTLIRFIAEIRERATNRLWLRLSKLPSDEQKVELERLLEISEGLRNSSFDRLKKGPVTISGPAFNAAVSRYKEFEVIGIHNLDFSYIPLARLKSLARHAGIVSMYKVGRMSDEKRIGFLVAFVRAFEVMALDDALDVFDMLITDIAGEAKKIGQKKRLRSLKDLDKSALTLAEVCSMIINDETEDGSLREAIYSKISKDDLAETILTIVYFR